MDGRAVENSSKSLNNKIKNKFQIKDNDHYLLDSGANIDFLDPHTLVKNRKRMRTNISSGLQKSVGSFSEQGDATLHVVDSITNDTFPLTIRKALGGKPADGSVSTQPIAKHGIISLVKLMNQSPRNRYVTKNKGKTLMLQLESDNKTVHNVNVEIRSGITWIAIRRKPSAFRVINKHSKKLKLVSRRGTKQSKIATRARRLRVREETSAVILEDDRTSKSQLPVNEVVQHMPKLCTEQHELEKTKHTKRKTLTCDVCNKPNIKRGSYSMSCVECDYDRCIECEKTIEQACTKSVTTQVTSDTSTSKTPSAKTATTLGNTAKPLNRKRSMLKRASQALSTKVQKVVRFIRKLTPKRGTVKSSTGKRVNIDGLNLVRRTRRTSRMEDIKVSAIDPKEAHRWLCCQGDRVAKRSVKSWLRSYMKRGDKPKNDDCTTCDHCSTGPLGKRATVRIDEPGFNGEILHADFQTSTVPGLGGENVALHVTDLKSGFITSAYGVTRRKEPTLDMVRECMNKMIVAGAHRPRIIYVDNDSSLNTKQMKVWQALVALEEERGFEIKFFPAKSQNKNGVIERFHRTRNDMMRKACHRANEPSDWLQWIADRHIVDLHNSFIVHEGHEITPSEELKGTKEDPHHLYTFMAKANVGNVSRLLLTNHTKGDDTNITAYYVGRDENGAKFLDPVTANIIFKSSMDYKIVDDLETPREVMPPELERMRRHPGGFPRISWDIPAKQNAYNQGKLHLSDLSRNEQRTAITKEIRKNLLDTKKGKTPAKSSKRKGKSPTLPLPFARKEAHECQNEEQGTPKRIGSTVISTFYDDFINDQNGIHACTGTVTEFNKGENLYTIQYEDGDTEQIFPSELEKLNPQQPITESTPKRRTMRTAVEENQAAACNFLQIRSRKEKRAHVQRLKRFVKTRTKQMNSFKTTKSGSKPLKQLKAQQKKKKSRDKRLHVKGAQAMLNQMCANYTESNQIFPTEFEMGHRGDRDQEFEDMEHVMTFDLREHDGTLKTVCNEMNAQGQNMSDTPKISEVCDESHPHYDLWQAGILSELVGLELNKVLKMIPIDDLTYTERKHLLPSQIILKMKRSTDASRTPTRAKARWVVGGHRAVRGYHHQESAAKGCEAATVRIMATIAASSNKLLMGTDITQAYTSAPLDPDNPNRIIIRLPKQLEFKDDRGVPVVAQLLMNTYGLVDGGFQFIKKLDGHLAKMGMEPSRNDHNLHRRYNEHGEIQLYAGYSDDGTGLFSSHDEYIKFTEELESAPFKLGLKGIQEETLGCKITQAGWTKEIGSLGDPGHIPGRVNDVSPGCNFVALSQPGLIAEILLIAGFAGKDSYVKPVQVPLTAAVSKQLDETIPSRKALIKSIAKIRAATTKGASYQDIADAEDPFAAVDDLDETNIPMTEEERAEFAILHPTFGVHYRTLVGKLLYLSRLSRPDIATAVSILSRYNSEPGIWALRGMKSLCRYLLGTPRLGITYLEPPNGEELEVRFYSDSNYPIGAARLGYVAMIGWTNSQGEFHGRALDWHSKVSATTSNSTAEAELYAAFHSICRALAIRKDLEHAGVIPKGKPCRIFEDNSAVCSQFNSPLLESKLKWINNKYLRVIELVASGDITVEHVSGTNNVSDTMTKGTIPHKEFVRYRKEMMGQ